MKLSTLASSYGLPRRPIEPRSPCSASFFRYGSEAYCEPRSEWWRQPGGGCRAATAASSAASAKSASILRLMAQPTTRRDQARSEEHTSELQSRQYLVCRLLLEKKKTPHN